MTDVIGFACLTPAVRRFVVASLFERWVARNSSHAQGSKNNRTKRPEVIEGEFERHDKD